MWIDWITPRPRLLGFAMAAFSLGVWCAGSFYYGPRIQKEHSALVHYKAQLAMAHAELTQAQYKLATRVEIQLRISAIVTASKSSKKKVTRLLSCSLDEVEAVGIC